eukprot:6428946-Prymnesium_polylepis.1
MHTALAQSRAEKRTKIMQSADSSCSNGRPCPPCSEAAWLCISSNGGRPPWPYTLEGCSVE